MTASTPVKYYVGDLCYVMHDVWEEVCSLIAFDNENWEYQLKDGRKFFLFNTAYGDGEYFDQHGGRYPVDSGTLGAILVDDIYDATYKLEEVGCIHEFESPLEEFECGYDNGEIYFGHIAIDTN